MLVLGFIMFLMSIELNSSRTSHNRKDHFYRAKNPRMAEIVEEYSAERRRLVNEISISKICKKNCLDCKLLVCPFEEKF